MAVQRAGLELMAGVRTGHGRPSPSFLVAETRLERHPGGSRHRGRGDDRGCAAWPAPRPGHMTRRPRNTKKTRVARTECGGGFKCKSSGSVKRPGGPLPLGHWTLAVPAKVTAHSAHYSRWYCTVRNAKNGLPSAAQHQLLLLRPALPPPSTLTSHHAANTMTNIASSRPINPIVYFALAFEPTAEVHLF